MEPNENMVAYLATSELIKTLKENSRLLFDARLHNMNVSAKFKLQPGLNGANALNEILEYAFDNDGYIINVRDQEHIYHGFLTKGEHFLGGEFIYICL